jgi:hypothetical protein
VSEPTATEEVAVEAVVETAPEAVVEAPAVSEPTATDVVAEVPAEPVTSEEAAE